MINLTVKTLDGRNHEFSVSDDISVLQFKNVIRDQMEIAVDRQRLLFQGRVLQDDSLLSSYNVDGNVMHLVTRPPPSQNRSQPEQSSDREENSDINRDQIRNILSDIFGNIAEFSNPLGVSVNNEGNRVDITVNMPSTNRLSLARLRQNYIHRLMNQARELINHLRDSNNPAPRPDRERLYQDNAYDLGPNEERITEVTAQPLPIHNLADMIHNVRDLWNEAEPFLDLWENILRRQNLPESIANSEREMQRMHDSASRYIHLFSHMLHIMSDYLVEFQHNQNPRIAVARNVNETVTSTSEVSTSTVNDENAHHCPLTGDRVGNIPQSEVNSDSHATASGLDGNNVDSNSSDRSRYLYVFSEMPAQLVQVRLDVDSTIQMPTTHAAAVPIATLIPQAPRSQPTRVPDLSTPPEPTNTTAPSTAAQGTESRGARFRRREGQFSVPSTMESLIRATLQDSLNGQPTRMNGSSSRSMRSGSQLIENVDPYVRCQSRHFQNPRNLRSAAVISTFGGIRFREGSRNRQRPTETPVTTAANTNNESTVLTNNTTELREGDPIRSFIGGLINSIFSATGDENHLSNETTPSAPDNNAPERTLTPPLIVHPESSEGFIASTGSTMNSTYSISSSNDLSRLMQTISSEGDIRLDSPIGQLFPEMFSVHGSSENIANQIMDLVFNRLTMFDFSQIVNGIYQPLNTLRVPLQNLLQRHQELCDGSRDQMLDNVVIDLEFINRAYMSVFDRLRASENVSGLSADARNNFNENIDISRTMNNLNRHHARVIVDMILRSPTDIGFGQLLMNSMLSHHNESLALLDIICGNNEELRQYMVCAFIQSLMSSMSESPDTFSQFISQSSSTFGFDWILSIVSSRLFRRPERLSDLRETVQSYVVFIDMVSTPTNISNTISNMSSDDCDQTMENNDSMENMVNSLSTSILNPHTIAEVDRPLDSVVSMDMCSYQQEMTNHTLNGSSWQSVLPSDWLDIVARDSNNSNIHQNGIGIPYSDAYVSGMPPKRRKIILNERHRNIQPVSEMMNDCIHQAILSAGINDSQIIAPPYPTNLMNSFQELVSDHVRNRLVEESFNFPNERFPITERHFNRKKRQEDDKKNS